MQTLRLKRLDVKSVFSKYCGKAISREGKPLSVSLVFILIGFYGGFCEGGSRKASGVLREKQHIYRLLISYFEMLKG